MRTSSYEDATAYIWIKPDRGMFDVRVKDTQGNQMVLSSFLTQWEAFSFMVQYNTDQQKE